MAQSKNLLKGTPRNKSVELTNSDNNSSGSTFQMSLSNQQMQVLFKSLIMMPLTKKVSLYQMKG